MSAQQVPPAAHHESTTSAFNHALSAQLDVLIVQLEHESTGRLHGAVLKLRKRWLERGVPALHAGQGGRHE
jgi:hypothetical protein